VSTPVNELACPGCGAALAPYDLMCSSCGTRVKHFSTMENLPPDQRELRDIANGAIAQAAMNLANAHRLGVNVGLADDLFALSKKSAIDLDFATALNLASKSGEEAETLTVQFEALQNRVRAARRAMEAAREDGADLRDCEELMEMADAASGAGDYKSALRYALKAAQRADRGRGRYQAWKVEISDWLK